VKVLYVLENYPQDSESYVEAEISYFQKKGVEIEVCSPVVGYGNVDVPVHRRPLASAIQTAKPDLVHIHYLSAAESHLRAIPPGLPVTIRAHSFDWSVEEAYRVANTGKVRAIYAFPHLARQAANGVVVPLPVAYDSSLFWRYPKVKSLVLRLAAGRRVKGLDDFLHVGNRILDARFVLGVCPVRGDESYVAELRETNRALGGRVQIRSAGTDLTRTEAVYLTRMAGIYLDTSDPKGHPFGMPISIAEALATGAYVLARENESVGEYMGEAAATYKSVDEAEAMVRFALLRSDAWWSAVAAVACARSLAFRDDIHLFKVLNDWTGFVQR